MKVIVKRFPTFYEVFIEDAEERREEVAYGDKHTRMEDIAQGFIELCAALNVECVVVDGVISEEF